MLFVNRLALFGMSVVFGLSLAHAQAPGGGLLRERLREYRAQKNSDADDPAGMADMGGNAMSCSDWSQKIERLQARRKNRDAGPTPDLKDVAYGPEARQKLDVFLPGKSANGRSAPIILMVHGGGWCVGDKSGAQMTANKVTRWVPKGFIFVSVNYPMVGDGSNALAQARYIATATAFAQAKSREWGGDPARVILMGHSAGAHLVSLVNADAAMRQAQGVGPILATVSLDAGAIDVVRQMPKVYPFLKNRYSEAFGTEQNQWIQASPFHKLSQTAAPWLGVCSTQRKDDPCEQARLYAEKSNRLGIRASVLPLHNSHGSINSELGTPGQYTREVESFLSALDPTIAQLLE